MDPCLPSYFCSLDENFIKQIKTVCFSGPRMLMVTKSDEVFGLGKLPDSAQYENVFEVRPIHELDRKQVTKFTFGFDFVIALTEKGELFSWGANHKGQLGLGHLNNINVPTKISTLPQEQKVIDVACGSTHAMILCKNSLVYAWGKHSESSPQLMLNDRIVRITCSAQGLFCLTTKGEVFANGYLFIRKDILSYSIGNGYYGNIPTNWTKINSLHNVIKIAAGKWHIIALDENGTVFIWGSNEDGQLTKANEQYQPSPVKLPNISKKFIDIATNLISNLSAAMTENAEIYIWGKQYGGKVINEPILTSCTSFDEVFATLSDPCLSLEPVTLNAAENIKYPKNESSELICDVQGDKDLTISIEGKNIFVHKAILERKSKYFQAMFTNNWKECNKKVLRIGGYSYQSFRSFISYLYTGEITITPENVLDLLNIGVKYSEEEMLSLIIEEIERSSSSNDVLKLVLDMMKLLPQDFEIFVNGMNRFMKSSTLEFVD